MKLYVIRHGETNWNKEKKIQGQADIDLNEKGILQAYEQKKELEKYKFDYIYSSPLKRTVKTAQIINENRKIPIIISEKIISRNFAEFQGVKRTNDIVQEFTEAQIDDFQLNVCYKNIEKIQDVCNRVWQLLSDLKKEHVNKNILLVAHGGICRIIEAYFEGIENGKLKHTGVNNCQLKIYEI